MREIEKKYRIEEGARALLESRLASSGFGSPDSLQQTDVYLLPPERNIYKEDRALRVRLEAVDGVERSYITYKGENVSATLHDRLEIETRVDDGEALLSLFAELGFKEFLRVSKVRKAYSKGRVSVSIDEVAGLGLFLEIEIMSEGGDASLSRDIDELAQSLGLSAAEEEARNYLKLLYEQKA